MLSERTPIRIGSAVILAGILISAVVTVTTLSARTDENGRNIDAHDKKLEQIEKQYLEINTHLSRIEGMLNVK